MSRTRSQAPVSQADTEKSRKVGHPERMKDKIPETKGRWRERWSFKSWQEMSLSIGLISHDLGVGW